MKSLFYLSLLVILNSCAVNENNPSIKALPIKSERIYNIPIDTSTSVLNFFDSYFINNNQEYYALQNRNLNAIQIYNIKNKKCIKKIIFPKEGPKGLNTLNGFCIVNFDSIFAFADNLQNILLVDSSGTVKKRIVLKDSIYNRRLFGYLGFVGAPPLWIKGKLYISVAPFLDPYKDEFFSKKEKLELVVDINTGNYKYLNINYPSRYQNNSWGGNMAVFSRSFDENKNFIYSFTLTDSVYVTNFKSPVKAYDLSCNLLNVKDVPPFRKGSELKYYFSNPEYIRVIFDKYRNLYYRIGYNDLYDHENEGITFQNKECTIVVSDANFKILGFHKLEKNKYLYRNIFVCKEGLAISLNNPQNETSGEDELRFSVFNFIL